jgi:hypothetical protein
VLSRTAVILQSSYIPWKGYFDLIGLADEFILYDDVQYTRRDWRNRNQIKTAAGLQWLTIPVEVKGRYFQSIRETRISDPGWAEKHWKSILHSYARAPHFKLYRSFFEDLYLGAAATHLSEVNYRFIRAICELLDIRTRITWSSDYGQDHGRSERLLSLCAAVGCHRYLSGPSAKGYLDVDLFRASGVEVEFMDYTGYPIYPQLHGAFEHHVSVVDLIFNTGSDAPRYTKSATHTPPCP